MILKIFIINILFFLVSCTTSFDKEIINHGPNLKTFVDLKIKKGSTKKSFIINKLGPPSFTNPYDNNNVYYVSQKMRKEIGKVNQFENTYLLEILYNKEDVVIDMKTKNQRYSNQYSLSELSDDSISNDRKVFEVFKNIFSNLRRGNKN